MLLLRGNARFKMETEQELKSTKAIVESLMTDDERCRNDDKWLTYRVFQEIAEQHGKKIFIPFELFEVFPAFESVKRVRAKIQNDENRLLPTNEDAIKRRKTREQEFRHHFGSHNDF